MIHDKQRVAAIRARATDQLNRLSFLQAQISKGELAPLLRIARIQTEDIETVLLNDLDRGNRNPEQEAVWLSYAERFLDTSWVPYLNLLEKRSSLAKRRASRTCSEEPSS